MLTPINADKPLRIDSYQWSKDKTKLLLFANTERVWRLNTRGDYWVLDIDSKALMQVGGDASPSCLMFAKFSPDAKQVAYVYKNDLYLQNLDDRAITRLTDTAQAAKINGTFDWVYEEEFSARDGFRFSPDGKRIAFWEINATGIEQFPLVNNTARLYPKIQYIPYPKVGTINPAAQTGVIDLSSRKTTWMPIPGDERENYLPRMEWIDDARLVIHDPSKTYPLIVYVYGEPAGQTVVDKWGGDQMLWHNMLAQQGYVVMSFDNRGTPAPRGRQWRKSVYRQIGILASADQAAAVKSVLKERPYLDPKRIGVWGWSGGGSMTLNALFRYPEIYAAGVSIAPSRTRFTTTQSIKSDTWVCQATTKRAIDWGRPLPLRTSFRVSFSSSTARAMTIATIRRPSC
jgi:dipeptidyl aminopeptidase/acylaminoacyl peptidase